MALIQPIMPVESTIGLQAIMKGFQGLAENRRYAQTVQLKLQQMAQDERQSQEKFDIEREQLAAQQPMYDAHAKYYKALGDAAIAKNTGDTEDLAGAAEDIKNLTKSGAAPGTSDYQTGLMNVYNDHMTSLGTLVGQRMWRPVWKAHELAGKNAWVGFRAANANYLNDLKTNGLSDYAFQNPEVWTDVEDGKKAAVIRFNGEVLKPTEENKKLANQMAPDGITPLATYKTLPKPEFDAWMKKHQSYQERQKNMPAINPFTGAGYDNLPAPQVITPPTVNQGAQQSQMDLALQWANDHPDDPRSAQIKQKLGVQ